jgi:hypothetical protein
LEGDYYGGPPAGGPFPRGGPGFGARPDLVTLPPVMGPPRR